MSLVRLAPTSCAGCTPAKGLPHVLRWHAEPSVGTHRFAALRRHPSLDRGQHVRTRVFPFDLAWAPNVNYQSLAPTLFAVSLFPYLGFLFHLTRSGLAPRVTLGGFYFLLVFVGATIPAGIYAKSHYGTALANVDWLHGSAESLLTITNLLIVLGLRQGIRKAEQEQEAAAAAGSISTLDAGLSEQLTTSQTSNNRD